MKAWSRCERRKQLAIPSYEYRYVMGFRKELRTCLLTTFLSGIPNLFDFRFCVLTASILLLRIP
jgi:hypothetical protein